MASPAPSVRPGVQDTDAEANGSLRLVVMQRRWGRRPHGLLSISQPPVWAAAPAVAKSCNDQ